jgi:hypothetical protein
LGDTPQPDDDFDTIVEARTTRLTEIYRELAQIDGTLRRLSVLELYGAHLRRPLTDTPSTATEITVAAATNGTPPAETSTDSVDTDNVTMIVVDLSTQSIADETQPTAAVRPIPEVSGTNPAETMTRTRSRRITRTTAVSETTIADGVPLTSHPETELPTSGPGGPSNRAESSAVRTSSPTTTAISSAITSALEPRQRRSEIDSEMVGARNRRWEELRRRFSGPRGSQE